MNSSCVQFYFDFISPYSYFAWIRVNELCDEHDIELKAYPVVFGKLLDHWGQLGPAEITAKREWLLKDCFRYAKLNNIELRGPKFHPFNSLSALRMALKTVANERQHQVISAIYEAGWSKGKDLGDVNELIEALAPLGLSEKYLNDSISSADVKAQLKTNTEEAIKLGVFGVPTMIVDKELFWGNDQFKYIELYLQGKDPLDQNLIKTALTRKRAIDRKKIQAKQQD